MNIWRFIILIFFVLLGQLVILPKINPTLLSVNLVLPIILMLVFSMRIEDGFWWAIVGGFLFDLYSPFYFGIYTLTFLAIAALASFLARRIFSLPIWYLAGPLFLGLTLLAGIIVSMLTLKFNILILYNGLVEASLATIGYFLIVGKSGVEDGYF